MYTPKRMLAFSHSSVRVREPETIIGTEEKYPRESDEGKEMTEIKS